MSFTNSVDKTFKTFMRCDKLNTSYPIVPENWQQFKTNQPLKFDSKKISFYFHIPFCIGFCKFCEYVKYKKPTKAEEDTYIDILVKDFENFLHEHNDFEIAGLDIGGGTPTALSEENLEKLLCQISKNIKNLKLSKNFVPSIEATFGTINQQKIDIIAKYGFKRISFGIQTISKKLLCNNNRANGSYKLFEDTFNQCRKAGIELINVDLMYGLKNQTKSDLKATVDLIKQLKPEHLTIYEMRTNILNVKENFSKSQLYKQYKLLHKKIIAAGYQGEFHSNTFSRVGDLGLSSYLQSRMIENINYKGFGISAQSKSEQGISYNVGKTKCSLEKCFEKQTFYEESIYHLNSEELLSKYVAISGYYGKFNLTIMDNILGQSAKQYFEPEINYLLKKRYISLKDNVISITKKGFKYYGAVLAMFYSANTKNYILNLNKTKNDCQKILG